MALYFVISTCARCGEPTHSVSTSPSPMPVVCSVCDGKATVEAAADEIRRWHRT
jgi:hypothetical protein